MKKSSGICNLEDRERTGSYSSDRSDFSVKFRYTIRF